MRPSTWIALIALLALVAHYPMAAAVSVGFAAAGITWALAQPLILATVLVGVVVHRTRRRWAR